MGWSLIPIASHSVVTSLPMNSFALSATSILGFRPCKWRHWLSVWVMWTFVFALDTVGIAMQNLEAESTIVNSVLLLLSKCSCGRSYRID